MSGGGSASGKATGAGLKVWGWLTVGVLLFGAPLMASFGVALAKGAGDAGHIIVVDLPILAQHIKGDVTKPAPSKPAPAKPTGKI